MRSSMPSRQWPEGGHTGESRGLAHDGGETQGPGPASAATAASTSSTPTSAATFETVEPARSSTPDFEDHIEDDQSPIDVRRGA